MKELNNLIKSDSGKYVNDNIFHFFIPTYENGLFHQDFENEKYTYKEIKISKTVRYTKSQLGEHLLKSDNDFFAPRKSDRIDWVTGLLAFILIIIVYVKVNFEKRFKEVLNALAGKRYVSLLSREGGLFEHKGSFELFTVFVLSAALIGFRVVYISQDQHELPFKGFIIFIQFCFIISLIYLIKVYVYRLLGWVFNLKEEFNDYIHNVFIINEFLGLVIYPFTVAIYFMDEDYVMNIFYIALYISLIFYLFRIFRGVSIWKQHIKLSSFYLFLYFCTFEILPMILLIKLFILYY